jgi:hypothetical protein
MAPESAKKVEKVETGTTLLEAAKKVLRQNSYAGMSTPDVAAVAGVPLRALADWHFARADQIQTRRSRRRRPRRANACGSYLTENQFRWR